MSSARTLPQCSAVLPGLSNRRALLLGTALASTLLLGTTMLPRPAHAVTGCATPPGSAIYVQADDSIVCINTEPRPAEPVVNPPGSSVAIFLETPADTSNFGPYSIYLNNSGALTTGPASIGSLYGIYAQTLNDSSPIAIVNSGDVTLNTEESGTFALGIRTRSFGDDSPISIENSGNISVSADETAFGIRAEAFGVDGPITIENSGDISATSLGGGAAGISAVTLCCYSAIAITNSGNIAVDARGDARGIDAQGIAVFSDVGIKNSGAITASAKYFAYGIYTETNQTDSDISISNSGAVNVSASSGSAFGIRAPTVNRARLPSRTAARSP